MAEQILISRATIEQVLEAFTSRAGDSWTRRFARDRAIEALETALAQAEPVEPVECPSCEDLGYVPLSEDGRSVFIDGIGLVPLAQQAEPDLRFANPIILTPPQKEMQRRQLAQQAEPVEPVADAAIKEATMSDGWRKGFEEWWNKNRVEAHKVKNMGGFAAKIWKAALDHERAVAGATESTSGFYPEDGGSIPLRQANTAPSQRKPLTDDEIEALFKGVDSEDKGRFAIVRGFARALKQAHGIKAVEGGSNG